ncbi:MAG: class I SAM-dependent methyltransferase [Alphaproteobacteria bacterium]|nr:class I SAM-dependent methyltransferase [Alphaproteobacteria bacterium]
MNMIAETLPAAAAFESVRRFPQDRTARYLAAGHRSVDGWLTPLSARVLSFLLAEQARLGVRGAVGEIGVHHGKLFLIAYLATRSDERAFAIDVFDMQEFNVDQSGKGDRERFLANVRRHAGSTDGLVVITADSLKLSPQRILDEAGRARFVSVDGGHTEECAFNDLRLAEACLAEGGIILLDDYFNHHWPDVSVGAARHFLSADARTKPFLVTPNKVFAAEPRYHGAYQTAVRERFRPNFNNSAHMFASAVDIYLIEGLRGLGGAISSLIADEARMRLARSPGLKAFLKRLAGR